jgi:site-specific recombinase
MALLTVTSDALSQTASHIPLLSHFKYDYELYMLIPICAQLHYAKINGPKYAFSGIFAYGDPRMQISRVQNVCKSPYANPHMRINTAQTLKKCFFCSYGIPVHIMKLCAYGD